tara:strand:- start:1493 stop:1804 length:312 start_codon:yes stop_codon:yes gene_type:complete
MRYVPGPTLSYGDYDPPTPWARYLGWLLFVLGMGSIGVLACIASNNHVDAALYAGPSGLGRKEKLKEPNKQKVALSGQLKEEEKGITHENREWLNNNTMGWSK